ncbi:phosphatidylinositol-specific phospholipase C domain-containing protein [Bacillus cereus]|nr:phosphatidylinositol-specific phospholipase C domain-containing protein [Bacillus cereus]MEB9571315.1 phosphatidylinositol-specific phospholipase C domain-containing protein [Bacillus cereus]
MGRSGSNVNQSVHYTNKDWMKYIPDSYRISQLSIPGTHGSMALYGSVLGDILINQTMSLDIQLNPGIRYIDIRCRHYNNTFPIHHNFAFQVAYFDDVLFSVRNFLNQNPRETILMRVQEEYDPSGNTRTFGKTFESYFGGYKQNFQNRYNEQIKVIQH